MKILNTLFFSAFRRVIFLILIAILFINPMLVRSAAQNTLSGTADSPCRFGITSALGSAGYDIASLGVGSYLDWGAVNNPALPEGVEYIRVLRLRDDLYPQTLTNLPNWVEANPGGIWVVGNEPDTTYEHQDALLAEVYADRYYALAQIIRQHDPTAKIGFGTVVQPTPIRIRYLQEAWDHLALEAGGYPAASSLVDFWSIHAFILNEDTTFGNTWGTGVPPGFLDDHDDAFIIDYYHLYFTYSIDIFQPRILAFRDFMNRIGERDKPLWITEYGSLLPPVDPIGGPDYVNVSDEDTAAFMLATFNFMLGASDELTGLPADGNKLVQRWYWYSLNDHRYHFGGSLYNPDYPEFGDRITLVGQSFINYLPHNLTQPDIYPVNLQISPITYTDNRTLVNYRIKLQVGNSRSADTGTYAQIWVYDGDPDDGGALISGPISSDLIQRCGGSTIVNSFWMGIEPLIEHNLCVVVAPVGVEDTNPANNTACFSVYLETPDLLNLPAVMR